MRSVLFLCVANSARSQMAEGLGRRILGPGVRAQSAGSHPAAVHPLAIRAMKEIGIDISGHESKSVKTIDPASVDTVITLCAEEVCPVFLGRAERLHWPLPDPAVRGRGELEEETLSRFRNVREILREKLEQWARGLDTTH